MIEFALNAATFASTELSIFMTKYEFEPRMSFDSFAVNIANRSSVKERIIMQRAEIIANKIRDI